VEMRYRERKAPCALNVFILDHLKFACQYQCSILLEKPKYLLYVKCDVKLNTDCITESALMLLSGLHPRTVLIVGAHCRLAFCFVFDCVLEIGLLFFIVFKIKLLKCTFNIAFSTC